MGIRDFTIKLVLRLLVRGGWERLIRTTTFPVLVRKQLENSISSALSRGVGTSYAARNVDCIMKPPYWESTDRDANRSLGRMNHRVPARWSLCAEKFLRVRLDFPCSINCGNRGSHGLYCSTRQSCNRILYVGNTQWWYWTLTLPAILVMRLGARSTGKPFR